MAEETITILKVGTEEAVKSIADLRENVKVLKDHLKELESQTGDSDEKWQEYQTTLESLKVNQSALKDAAYATSGTFEDLTKAAVGATTSYNGLVNKMAELKREFRSTNDEARRLELGRQINDINTKLKEMDALQGNFQRNVGNYSSAFKGLGDNVDAFKKSLDVTKGGLNGVKGAMDGLAKSPWVATAGLLVSLCMKLADELKKNDKAMEAIKKLMKSLEPIMDFFSQILADVVDFLADIIVKVADFLGSSGLMNKIIKGVMGVGNAILQYVIAPFKGIIAAIKVFQEEGVGGLRNAGKAFLGEMKHGISFKSNYEAGAAAGDAMLQGMADKKNKEKAKKTGQALGKETADGWEEEMNKRVKAYADRIKAQAEAEKYLKDLQEKTKSDVEDFDKEMEKMQQAEFDALMKQMEDEAAQEKFLEDIKTENAKKAAEQRKAILQQSATAISGILGAIAGLYEADSEGAEKNANKAKALRIAAASIDTISGAVGAYMQASKTYPPPYGQIFGAAQAAIVTATGLANIAKMRSTNVTDASASPSVTATASAPAVNTPVTNVRTVTSASEEERLNQMASDQRVYILASDIQASQGQIKTQVDESSF